MGCLGLGQDTLEHRVRLLLPQSRILQVAISFPSAHRQGKSLVEEDERLEAEQFQLVCYNLEGPRLRCGTGQIVLPNESQPPA